MIDKPPKPILWAVRKKHIKLLRPIEYQASYFAPEKHRNRLLLDCSNLIPDRITELEEMWINRQWLYFEEKNIHIMAYNEKMVKRTTSASYMQMNIKGTEAVRTFLDNRYYISSYQAMGHYLNLSFNENGGIGMKEYVEEWI